MTRSLCLLVTAFAHFLGLSIIPSRGDWAIVPGQRIGEIRVGMSYAGVIRALGTPSVEEDLGETKRTGIIRPSDDPSPYAPVDPPGVPTFLPQLSEILRDDWIKPQPIPPNSDTGDPVFMCTFVTVYTDLNTRRVVQIEERVPRLKTREGCSTDSTALELREYFPHYQTTRCQYHHPSSEGIPAAKHFVNYDDAVGAGIAWRYGGMGNLSLEPGPDETLEIIIVHAPGKPALLDPDGDSRFIWKIAPASLGQKADSKR